MNESKYICPKCNLPAEKQVRTRIGKTQQVRYTSFHQDVNNGISECNIIMDEPITQAELDKYKPEGIT